MSPRSPPKRRKAGPEGAAETEPNDQRKFRNARLFTYEKVLALGPYRLAHSNSYLTIAPVFNVGKSIVIEAVQEVAVNGLALVCMR